MTYAEKLKDPRWQKKRLEILNRDNWTCIECGATDKTLNVHHKLYMKGRDPWNYQDAIFVTLCEDCHREREIAVKFLMAFLLEFSTGHFINLTGLLNTLLCEHKGNPSSMIVSLIEKLRPEHTSTTFREAAQAEFEKFKDSLPGGEM